MNRKLVYTLLFLLLGVTVITSCRDDFFYEDGVIGEGSANISATVSFHPLISALDENSRAAGNAIKNITKLQVVIYTYKEGKGEFFKSLTFEGDNLNIIKEDEENYTNTDMPAPYDKKHQAEERTAQASFELKDIPFGRYYMYVVGNYYGEDFTKETVPTPGDLKAVTVEWNETNLSANAQMFGCLATDAQSDYNDHLLTINRKSVDLHAWIKRLASKLTLVFDGSGLHEGIFVYINKATIRDIPKFCHFGADNSPFKKDGKYASRENIPANFSDSIIAAGESLFYNEKGKVSSTTPENATSTDYEYIRNHWMQIDKATKAAGAVDTINNTPVLHSESAQALYFYENCQGAYDDQEKYNKNQDWDKVGNKITEGETDKEDYKDEVICGTYVEVEGYYSANYNGYLSSGPIKYRFMLGQDVDYNYNAFRNRHYKLTLRFKGYANQPDWHIEYEDEEPGLYPPEEFLMSYMYNVRHEMPIRLTGYPTKVTMQIVENNWAPYDPDEPDLVPPPVIENPNENGLPFEWNRPVYEGDQYYYGLHSIDGNKSTPYASGIVNGAPTWVKDQVTPIWVGFLALQAPTGYEDENKPLPAGIYNIRYPDGGENFYDREYTITGIKNYFYGKEDNNETEKGVLIRQANHIPLYENVYNIPGKENLSNKELKTFNSGEDNSRRGRNSYKAGLNADGSVTIYVPMFTQPKDMGYISGFSGNNPYEAYNRKAVVKITAKYEGDVTIVKYVPIFQTKRIVNPKAVWRTWNDKTSFLVTLMSLEDYKDKDFTPLESIGLWEAWIATPEKESEPYDSPTFELEAVGGAAKKDGKIIGITGSVISFRIKFNGVDKNATDCGKIIVHYHDNNCEHSIYVRQGYNVPVKVTDGEADPYWSSYAVFSFDSADDSYDGVFKPERSNGSWKFPNYEIPGLKATLTVNPLALGTMYKRGNYAEGIRIINNTEYPVKKEPGELTLTKSSINPTEKNNWNDITGIPFLSYSYSSTVWNSSDQNATDNWKWSQFESTVPDELSDNTYRYDLPTIEDYQLLMRQGFGIGVAYADGATETARSTDEAFGFFNEDNKARENTKGMRGFIVYNLKNFNQIFFPLGYSGVGRRTIQNPDGKPGLLRYGNQAEVLKAAPILLPDESNKREYNNQFRPIPYNNPNNPGVIYWAKKKGDNEAYGMDMNYFDLNFAPQDYAICFVDYGDAIPIKPVIRNLNSNNSTRKPRKKKTR